MKNAYEKAIEGNYECNYWNTDNQMMSVSELTQADYNRALLDPLFWQALGKHQGWEESMEYKHHLEGSFSIQIVKTEDRWKKEWHNFIDHIASGKNIDEFFNKLLTN